MKKIWNLIIFTMILASLSFSAVALDGPVLKVSLSKYEPTPAEPGKYVDVYIRIQNTGNGDAKDAWIEFIPQFPFTPIDPSSGKISIGILGSQKDYVANFKLKVDPSALEGETALKFKYASGSTDAIQEKEMTLLVRTFDSNIDIISVKTEPSQIVPGDKFNLEIELENTAQSFLKDVSLDLELEKTATTDLPFAPVDSSTQKRIALIMSDEKAKLNFNLVTYPSATSGVYKIPVTLTFSDAVGNSYTKSDIISLIIKSEPDLLVTLDSSTITKQNLQGDVSFAIINKGFDEIKFMTLTLKETDDYEVFSTSDHAYIGKIDSDDFETADFSIKLRKNLDKVDYAMTLEYKDSNNNDYTKDIIVNQKIIASNGDKKSGSSSLFFLVVLVVIIVGFVLYFRKKKKK